EAAVRPTGAMCLRRQTLPRLLHRRHRRLRPREHARADVDRRGLRRDGDLLARCGVAARPRLRRRLEPDGQLDEVADLDLLRVADLVEHDLFERLDCRLRLREREPGALGDGLRELSLGECHECLLDEFVDARIQVAAADGMPSAASACALTAYTLTGCCFPLSDSSPCSSTATSPARPARVFSSIRIGRSRIFVCASRRAATFTVSPTQVYVARCSVPV